MPGTNSLPISSIIGIGWPAIATNVNATVLGILAQLQQSEWWSLDQLQAAQFLQLRSLLKHSFANVPFYKDKLKNLGWNPEEPLTLASWQHLSVLTRQQVQDTSDALTCKTLGSTHGELGAVHTSGSVGTPIKVSKTAVSNIIFVAVTLRDHFWHRRNLQGKFAQIRTFPDGVAQYPAGARQGSWGGPLEGLYKTGEGVALAITASIEQQLEWLQRQQPEYLLTFPSVADALARQALLSNTRLESLTQLATVGEALGENSRQLCRNAFGVDLVDMYSAQEVGYLALQCPDTENYHIQSESAYVEVLDENDQPCGPGQVGRVVATPLQNFATPLIRYEIGDYAEVGEPCPCGRGLPTLTRVLGRTRNIMTLPDGAKYWPRLSELRYCDIVPVQQFQVVQKSLQQLEVKLVPARPVTPEEERQLASLINSRIGHPFAIEFSYHQQIPRSASGKYEDFRSEL